MLTPEVLVERAAALACTFRDRASETERQRHVAGAAFSESDSGNLYDFVDIGKGELVLYLDAEQYLAVGIERPNVSLLYILLV